LFQSTMEDKLGFQAVMWICDILVRIRIRESVSPTDLQILPFSSMTSKVPSFFAFYF
jgi:hypothetical protein